MARPRQTLDDNVKQAGRVTEALRKGKAPGWQVQRLTAVRLGLAGELSVPAIAEAVGSSQRTVHRWFDAYRAGGVDALLTRKKGKGRAPMLDSQKLSALKEAVSTQNFRRAADAQEWIREHLKVETPIKSVYRYLGKSSRG
jgi:putative transposase